MVVHSVRVGKYCGGRCHEQSHGNVIHRVAAAYEKGPKRESTLIRTARALQRRRESEMRWETALYACTKFSAWKSFDAVVERTARKASSRCPLLLDFLEVTLSCGESDVSMLSAGEAIFLALCRSPGCMKLRHGTKVCCEEGNIVPMGIAVEELRIPVLKVRASMAVWKRETLEGLPICGAFSVGKLDRWDEGFWAGHGGEKAIAVASELRRLFAEGASRTGRGFAGVIAGAMVTRGGVGVGLVGDGVVCVAVCEERGMVRVSRVYRGLEAAVAVAAGFGEGVRREEQGLAEMVRSRVFQVGKSVERKVRSRRQHGAAAFAETNL